MDKKCQVLTSRIYHADRVMLFYYGDYLFKRVLILYFLLSVSATFAGNRDISKTKSTFRCQITKVLDVLTVQKISKYKITKSNILQHQQSVDEERKLLSLFGGIPRQALLHIIEVPTGGYRVFRLKDGNFVSKYIESHYEAKKFLQSMGAPLDLGSHSSRLGKELLVIKKQLGQIIGPENISNRIKDNYSVKRKIFKLIDKSEGSMPLAKLKDLIGFRVVVNNKKQVLQMVQKLKVGLNDGLVKIKSVNKTDQTGYRAVHIIAKSPQGQYYEIQVMTELMKKWHAWDHKYVYKSIYPPGEYLDHLIDYSRRVARHVRRLEDGKKSVMPDYRDYNILEKDAFKTDIEITNR